MSLTFYVLNVGQGSSIVIEYDRSGDKVFGVVDSNAAANATPRAFLKLQELGASKLSFVCLTHPHDDHVSGLYTLVQNFPNAIDAFYCCPLGDLLQNRERLKRVAQKLKKLTNKSTLRDQRYAALEPVPVV